MLGASAGIPRSATCWWDEFVAAVGSGLDTEGRTVNGRGAALLPGLHDHHAHLFATAAAATSVDCGPPRVRTREQLGAALMAVPGTGWVRGVGYGTADCRGGAPVQHSVRHQLRCVTVIRRCSLRISLWMSTVRARMRERWPRTSSLISLRTALQP